MSGGFDTETRKWLVAGRVQGVGYRAFAARTGRGLGLVHTQDMATAADWVEAGRLRPRDVVAAELPARYGYVLSPAAARA